MLAAPCFLTKYLIENKTTIKENFDVYISYREMDRDDSCKVKQQ